MSLADWVYLATLALMGWAAVRRTSLSWWKQLLALGALVLLGGIVIVLQLLAPTPEPRSGRGRLNRFNFACVGS